MSTVLDRYKKIAVNLGRGPQQFNVISDWVAADIEELMSTVRSQVPWATRMRELAAEGPIAGLGFQGLVLPNAEMVNAPSATTGVTAETNLYTPATTTNAAWAIMPQGSMKSPQTWIIEAGGIITSSSSAQTCVFTGRIGTSGTPATNQSLGATGAVALGSTITNAVWHYRAIMTMRGPGTSATAMASARMHVDQQAAGSGTSSNSAGHGNTTATFDMTLQQGYVISVTPSATGVSVTLTNFVLLASD